MSSLSDSMQTVVGLDPEDRSSQYAAGPTQTVPVQRSTDAGAMQRESRSDGQPGRAGPIGFATLTDRAAGGIFQYARSLGAALAATYDVVELPGRMDPTTPSPRRAALRARAPALITLRDQIRYRRRLSTPKVAVDAATAEEDREAGVSLVVYPAPAEVAFRVPTPYVVAIHDLQHRLNPQFPEVSAGAEWHVREYLFRNLISRAAGVLVDSHTGKEDVLEFYGASGIEPDRVHVVPFVPPPTINPDVSAAARAATLKRLSVPDHFLLYPAQFWPHKNHHRLVEAVAAARRSGVRIELVLAGGHSGRLRSETYRRVMRRAAGLGIAGQVHDLGYVSDEDLNILYLEAMGLAFPTFFGPTNIPVVEAWRLGCPVLTSDIRGIREHVGPAAILVDPTSIESIRDGLVALWSDERLRDRIRREGSTRVDAYGPLDFRARVEGALEHAKGTGHRRGAQ